MDRRTGGQADRQTDRQTDMGWLRLVGSLKSYVSFAEYSLFYRALLQKRPIILRSLLIVATPEADGPTDRQKDRQIDRWIDRKRERDTHTHASRQQ